MDKPSKKEDRFESMVKRVLGVLDENRGIAIVAVVAAGLIAGAIFFKVNAEKNKERMAWNKLAMKTGDSASPSDLRALIKQFEGTSTEFYFRLVFARRLYSQARHLEAKRDETSVQQRKVQLSEAVDTLALAHNRFPDHALAETAQKLFEALSKELEWVTRHQGSLSPETPREYKKKEWKKKVDKQARPVENMDDKPGENPQVTLETTQGVVVIELFEDDAPNHVANFISLVEEGSLDGRDFFDVRDTLVAAGCPNDDGSSVSEYLMNLEVTTHPIEAGSVGMMLDGENQSAGAKFFLARAPIPPWNGKITIFGRVLVGLSVLKKLTREDRLQSAWLDKKRLHDYAPMVKYRKSLVDEDKAEGKEDKTGAGD